MPDPVEFKLLNYILVALSEGRFSRDEAQAAARSVFQDAGYPFDQADSMAKSYLLGQPGFTPGMSLAPGETERQYGTEAAFSRALGLGTTTARTPFQRYQEAQYDPVAEAYGLQQALTGVPETTGAAPVGETSFEEFAKRYTPTLQPTAGGQYAAPVQLSGKAQSLLKGLAGLTPEQREAVPGWNFAAQPGEGEYPSIPSTAGLGSIMTTAMRPVTGGLAARYIARQLPGEQQRWMGLQAAGQEPEESSFMDYLARRFPQLKWY